MSEFHCGYTALIGKPNTGKSTLVNALLGQKVAPVSPRAQTTRQRQLGILTSPHAQIILIDTPGLHVPRHKLGEYLNQAALDGLKDADVVVWLVDASREVEEADRLIAGALSRLRRKARVILAANKMDLVDTQTLAGRLPAFTGLFPVDTVLPISAVSGAGLEELLKEIAARLPVRPPEYPEDQVTDLYEREIAAELVREAALLHLREEVPHCLAVRMDEYKERPDGSAYVHATLFVEKESQKGIVIGQKGDMLKRIGISARQEIERMSGRRIFLELRVKVEKNWRDNEQALNRFGYRLGKGK